MRCVLPFILASVACAGRGLPASSEPRCLSIVGNSDLHGALEPTTLRVGNATLRSGGLLALGAYVEVFRSEYGERLLLLDAGDLYQGTLASNLSYGEAVIAAYNALGFDAAAIGNHEFDFGGGATSTDLLAVVKERARQALFPFLSVNTHSRQSGTLVAWDNVRPSVLLTRGGIRVGIIGAITAQAAKVTMPTNVVALEFPEPAPLIVAEAQKLRAEGAELVVLTAHIGGRCKSLADPKDLQSCEQDSELFVLLNALPPGTIDVALGGHSHAYVGHWVNGVATIQAGSRGRQLAWADVCVDGKGAFDRARTVIHRPVDMCLDEWAEGGCRSKKAPGKTRPAQFLGKPLAIPEALSQTLQPFQERVAQMAQQPIGVRLPVHLVRDAQGPQDLGGAIAQSMAIAAEAHFGIQNRGGVRADLPLGDITYGQVFEVLPFDNRVTRIRLTGAQVQRFAEHLIYRRQGSPPYVYGLKINRDGSGAWRVLLSNDQPLDPELPYLLATSDFLAHGGEGLDEVLSAVAEEDIQVMDLEMRQAFVDFLISQYGQHTASQTAHNGLN